MKHSIPLARLGNRAARLGAVLSTAALLSAVIVSAAVADWRKDYPKVTQGVSSHETEAATMAKYQGYMKYMSAKLGVPFKIKFATDYAATMEALKSGHLQFARMGGANYALAHRLMGKGVEPLIVDEVRGGRGYRAVVLVRSNTKYKSISDLKGKIFAFVDPNSTSGYAAPNYFLSKQGFDPKSFFGKVLFAGSHENAVVGLVNKQFDAVATWEFTENYTNVLRMAKKGLVDPKVVRKIWGSPLMPNPMYAGRTDVPKDLRKIFVNALLSMKKDAPTVWKSVSDGRLSGYGVTKHEEYLPIIQMTEWNKKQRRKRK